MPRLFAPLALLFSAAPLMADPALDGRYELDACTGRVGESTITLSDYTIAYWESRCDLSAPMPVRGMGEAVLYDATCAGEGETWERRLMLMPVWQNGPIGRPPHDGLIIVGDNYADYYAYCGPVPR